MPRYMYTKTHFFEYDIDSILQPADASESNFTATKVIFTIGPACQDVDTLVKILEAGATAARIDLTWGTLEYHEQSLTNLSLAVKKSKRLCAIILDTIGREIYVKRTSKLGEDGWPYHDEQINIVTGQKITLTGRDVAPSHEVWPLNYAKLPDMAEIDDFVYVSRYLVTGADSASLYMKIVEVNGTDVVCEAQNNAVLDGLLTIFHIERNQYGTIKNIQNEQPILAEADKEAIEHISRKFEVDFLCMSHTRETQDLVEAKKFLDSIGMQQTKLLAKVETKYGLSRFKGILNAADGIVISRGNLGLDSPPEKMTLLQKNMISACNLIGKPVLVTRLLDTMAAVPRPTRAEATDVANAVLDGVDGFLLGAETLRGKYPEETVNTVMLISKQAEAFFDNQQHFEYLMQEAVVSQDGNGVVLRSPSGATVQSSSASGSYADLNNAIRAMTLATENHNVQAEKQKEAVFTGSPYLSKLESIASSAVRAADKIKASLLIVYTHSGQTGQLVAKYRPKMPILTLVVPVLVSNSLSWKLEDEDIPGHMLHAEIPFGKDEQHMSQGRGTARQCLITRGLLPMLAAPRSSIDSILEEAVMAAAAMGIVKQNDHVVCVQRIHEDFAIKIISVTDLVGTFKRVAEVLPNQSLRDTTIIEGQDE